MFKKLFFLFTFLYCASFVNAIIISSNNHVMSQEIVFVDNDFPAKFISENDTHYNYVMDYSKNVLLETKVATAYSEGIPVWSPTKMVSTEKVILVNKSVEVAPGPIEEVIDTLGEMIGIEPTKEYVIQEVEETIMVEEVYKVYEPVQQFTFISIPKEVGLWHIGNESTIIQVTNQTLGLNNGTKSNYGIQLTPFNDSLIRYINFDIDKNNTLPITDLSLGKNPNTIVFTFGNSIVNDNTCFKNNCWSQTGQDGNQGTITFNNFASHPDLNLSKYSSYSIFFRLRLNNNATTQNFVSNLNYLNMQFISGNLYCTLDNSATKRGALVGLNVNQTYLIGCVVNSTEISVYRNLDNGTDNSFSALSSWASQTLNFGVEGTANYMNGTMDDIMIFNRSLTSSEISDLYNNITGFYTSPASFVTPVQNFTAVAQSEGDTLNITVNASIPTGTQINLSNRFRNVNCSDNSLISFDFDTYPVLNSERCQKFNLTYLGGINNTNLVQDNIGGFALNVNSIISNAFRINTQLINMSSLTLIAWINTTSTASAQTIIRQQVGSANILFRVEGSNYFLNTIDLNGSDDCSSQGTVYVPLNTFGCYAFIYNGTHCYTQNISGNKFNIDTANGIFLGGNTSKIYGIGERGDGNEPFSGSIGNFEWFNISLNNSQVNDWCNYNYPNYVGFSNYSSPCDVSINSSGCFFNRTSNFTQVKFDFYTNSSSITPILYDYSYTIQNSTGEVPGDIIPPNITFNYKIPADIIGFNAIGVRTNISYNITDDVAVNESSITFYYKTNSSLNDCSLYINGTSYCGFQNGSLQQYNTSNVWNFMLGDNRIYPATYNFEPQQMEDEPHNSSLLSTSNSYLGIEFLNVSNQKAFGFFEIMSNSSNIAQRVYYCNSSYNFISTLASNTNCVNFYTIPAGQNWNHTHPLYSKHQVVPFAINTTTNRISTIKVTSTSYFFIRDNTGGTINYSFINNLSRIGATKISTNAGTLWTNQTYTVDSHLHQFSDNDTFYYYVCASDNSSNRNCSTIGQDTMSLAGLPPDVVVYSPTETVYSGNININYTYNSPNGYSLNYSNISLYNTDMTRNSTIRSDNGANLSYVWNSTGFNGDFFIQVCVKDTQNQSTCGYSSNFSIILNSCTYSTGNWNINCADNCILSTNTNLNTNNITISGTGNITITANITNSTRIRIFGTDTINKCRVKCLGGCFKR